MNAVSHSKSMVHYAKVDWWVAALIGGAALAEVTGGAKVFISGLTGNSDPNAALGIGSVLVGVGLLFGLLLWGCYRTRYEITGSALIVRFGPFRTTVLLDSIVEVFPTHNPISAPAPSLDRLKIKYRSKNGGMRSALISPKGKEEFLRDLASAAPRLRSTADGPLRLKAAEPAR